ncbi:uncharacterized protein LOC142163874 [Nicotiana tabacum]|uniref:Uncharacterized protein LOC142163874 n=1 Tax=Nicotiana tabacum TaxID=4097 RepID=A0AC58RWR7_TOBAC
MSNINGKIWIFFDAAVVWELVMDTEQQVTIKLYYQDIGQYIMLTFIYAKCSLPERMELWDNLYFLASDMEFPWVVGGDFNIVLHEYEKIGGGQFTLLNMKTLPFNLFSTIGVEHLIRTRSDHAPLFMSCGEQATNIIKPFKFLNFWAKHETFKEVVRQNSISDYIGGPYIMFKQKLKRMKIYLYKWSKETYRDIFKQLSIREDIVKLKEMLLKEEPTVENRIVLEKAQAELKRYLSIEEQYWKQKAGMTWFAEGDRNTRFFHNHVNGKR